MDGILRQDVAALAEAHLSECSFCREGLAGLQKADARGDLQENLLDLQLRIRQSARERETIRPAYSISRQTLRWAAVSAAAILIIGLIFSFLLLDLEPLKIAHGVGRRIHHHTRRPEPDDAASTSAGDTCIGLIKH
jgi:hypothetical protein